MKIWILLYAIQTGFWSTSIGIGGQAFQSVEDCLRAKLDLSQHIEQNHKLIYTECRESNIETYGR